VIFRQGMGDIDVSSTVVGPGTVSAEIESFDGRLNAWLLDFGSYQTPYVGQAFIDQVDAFVSRWRAFPGEWFFWGTSRLEKLLSLEAEFNKLRDQADQLAAAHGGQATTIQPATVTSRGQTYAAGQQPPDEDAISRITTLLKWGAGLAAVGLAVKVSSDFGLFRKLGSLTTKRTT
jgi:hypothetical protein